MAKPDGNRVRVSRKDIYEIEVGGREPLQLTEEEATRLLQSLEAALGISAVEPGTPAPEELSPVKEKTVTPAASAPRRSKTLTPRQRRNQTLIMSGIVVIIIAAAFVAYNLQAGPSSTGGFKPPAAPYRHFSLTGENDLTFNGTSPGPTITVPNNTVVWITFTVSSTSSASHSWVLVPGNANHNLSAPNYAPVFNASTPDPTGGTAPGHTDQVVFNATAIGSYLYICEVPGHFLSGMFGYFNVTAGNGSTNATSVASVQTTGAVVTGLSQHPATQGVISVRTQVQVATAWFTEWNGV